MRRTRGIYWNYFEFYKYFCPECNYQLIKKRKSKDLNRKKDHELYDILFANNYTNKEFDKTLFCEDCDKEFDYTKMNQQRKSQKIFRIVYSKNKIFSNKKRCLSCNGKLVKKYKQYLIRQGSLEAKNYNIEDRSFKKSEYVRYRVLFLQCKYCKEIVEDTQ